MYNHINKNFVFIFNYTSHYNEMDYFVFLFSVHTGISKTTWKLQNKTRNITEGIFIESVSKHGHRFLKMYY